MATPGFGGKILLVNLTSKEITGLDTDQYAMYGGGHGTSTALFWEYSVVRENWDLQDAFDPRNLVSLMSGAVSGSGIPYASRTSVSGMSPQCYPIQWWSHSNLGGTFSTMLKLAGWDGVAVIGKADSPVYINIVDDKVTIEDATDLWGMTTWKCQEEIWKRTGVRYGMDWQDLDGGYTLQRPAIVTIGAAGENMTRVASLIHGGGSGAGQGGFGGVFGSKNLKAVAVVGSGSLKIADPKALVDAKEKYFGGGGGGGGFGGGGTDVSSCCAGCGMGSRMCHNRTRAYSADSDDCAESTWYTITQEQSKGAQLPRDINRKGTDIIQEYGINGMETCFMGPMEFDTAHNPEFPIQPKVPAYSALGWYMMKMHEMKVIGPGTKFDMAPLPMDKFPSQEFMEIYGRAIAKREGIGKLLGEGTARFVEALDRKDDFNTLARQTMWGFMDHWSMPGVEWAYGNLLDSRDINSHDISWGRGDAEQMVKNYAAGTLRNEPLWFDYTWQGDQAYETGIYSKHKAEWVAWHQHYWNYYKESVGFCDWGYSNLGSSNARTPVAEPTFLNAITGRNHSFDDGLEIGRRTMNLKRAIYAIQGRHKKMENFSGFHYRPGASYCGFSATKPILNGDKWEFQDCKELYFSREGVDQFKTHFYNVEGWNPDSGYPTRKTLEDLGMKHVADLLESKGKLGAA